MEETGKRKRWWLFGLPALICLPCILPAIVAVVLAAGGIGGLGSFLGGAVAS